MSDSAELLYCWNCGARLDGVLRPVSRHEYCPDCAEAVHCCRQCTLFAPQRADQCREERAEHPTDKTAANFCDFFAPRLGPARTARDGDDQGARSRLDALFGEAGGTAPEDTPHSSDPSTADPAAAARARLDTLFGGDES